MSAAVPFSSNGFPVENELPAALQLLSPLLLYSIAPRTGFALSYMKLWLLMLLMFPTLSTALTLTVTFPSLSAPFALPSVAGVPS